MRNEEKLISQVKSAIESKTGWGNSISWTNQDFVALSKKITEETGASLSHMTLKRFWGKIKYESLPQIYTLNTLVQYIGYANWRDFTVKNSELTAAPTQDSFPQAGKKSRKFPQIFIIIILMGLATLCFFLIPSPKSKVDSKEYTFSSRANLVAGIPNSVVFNYDATKSPEDSVIIQLSWDTTRRTRVAKDEHQHTLIYYFPGFFRPKLVVGNQVVKEDSILIKSDGWLAAVEASPMPVYFKKKDFTSQGKMNLTAEQLKAQNISLAPQPPKLSFCNVQDFGEIYSDNFTFETAVRNDYKEGSAVCQMTNIYLLCEGSAVGIPLCAKGCESNINFFFTNFKVSGKQHDLSCFGVNFTDFVKVKVIAAGGKAKIFLNDVLCYQVDHDIIRSRIIGFDFVFQGTGSVDYVRLSNDTVNFNDEF